MVQTGNNDSSRIVTLRLASGQDVTLSRSALEIYGQEFIEELTVLSGQDHLLLIDNDIYEDAVSHFPDSETPLIDMYPDHVLNRSDWNSANHDPQSFQNRSDQSSQDYIADKLMNLDIMSMSDPNRNNGLIIIPDASDITNDLFKNKAAEIISTVQGGYFDGMQGSSLDWAKIILRHEGGHLQEGHARDLARNSVERSGQNLSQLDRDDNIIRADRHTLTTEIVADRISLSSTFNQAGNGSPPASLLDNFYDLRTISAIHYATDVYKLGAMMRGIQDHDTREAFHTSHDHVSDPDRIAFTTSYTGTLVRGLIGAVTGKAELDARQEIDIGYYSDTPLHNTTSREITEKDFKSAMRGDDPMRISALGRAVEGPESLYAATKALLEAGQFDHAPDSKLLAEDYIRAVERTAPGMMDADNITLYRNAVTDPENIAYLNQLHRYYDPETKIGFMRDPSQITLQQSAPAVMAP